MRKSTWPWLLGSVAIAATCFLLLAGRTAPTSARDLSSRGFQVLGTVIELIKYDYVEEPDPSRTMDGAFRGLVDSLDVLSTYLDPAAAAKFRQAKASPFKDIGVVLIKSYGSFPQVVGLVEGSPAAKAGLKVGDYLSSVENRSTLGMSLVETQLALKGLDEEPIRVKVVRQAENIVLSVKRGAPSLAPAWETASGTAGILHIPRLARGATESAKALLGSRLKESGPLPLIIDLRNCAEGEVEEAGRLLNLFLQADPAGKFVKRREPQDLLSCSQKPAWGSVPLAVWTNPGTQGPAEIVAAVLQDFQRAKVVGQPTPGLAARADILPLKDGSILLLTTGVFSLNSGKKVWGQGVKPDAEMEARDFAPENFLKKTLELYPSR